MAWRPLEQLAGIRDRIMTNKMKNDLLKKKYTLVQHLSRMNHIQSMEVTLWEYVVAKSYIAVTSHERRGVSNHGQLGFRDHPWIPFTNGQ